METPIPSEEFDQYWIYTTGDQEKYFELRDVIIPTDTSKNHVPDVQNDAVHEIDMEAVEHHNPNALVGRWRMSFDPSEVDEIWECVLELASENKIYRAKVMSKLARLLQGQDQHDLLVYTPNYIDKDDVFRVRDLLHKRCGVTQTIDYRPNFYDEKRIRERNAEKKGLPGDSRYSE